MFNLALSFWGLLAIESDARGRGALDGMQRGAAGQDGGERLGALSWCSP